MKITTFDPLIVSKKADDVIAVFEALGFETTHAPVTATETGDVQTKRMKNESGFRIALVEHIS